MKHKLFVVAAIILIIIQLSSVVIFANHMAQPENIGLTNDTKMDAFFMMVLFHCLCWLILFVVAISDKEI